MITDYTGPQDVLLPINHNYNKISSNSVLPEVSEKIHSNSNAMAFTVQLIRYDAHFPINYHGNRTDWSPICSEDGLKSSNCSFIVYCKRSLPTPFCEI